MGETINLVPIPSQYVPAHIPIMVDILDRSPDTWEDYYTRDEIIQGVLEERYRLWVGYKDKSPKLIVLSSVIDYGQRKIGYIEWIGGEDIYSFLPFLSFIEDWAFANDCSRLEIRGRPAWLRLLGPLGYEQTHVVIGKSLVKDRGH